MEATSLPTPQSYAESEQYPVQEETKNSDTEEDLVLKHSEKLLYFCDGTLDECELHEDEPDVKSNIEVDPKKLPWGPWLMRLTTTAGSKTLQAIDYVGETLANFFGITTPKYQYEIDEFEIMRAEEEEEKKHQDLEMGGWTGTSAADESKLPENGSHVQEKCNEEIHDDTVRSQPQSLQS